MVRKAESAGMDGRSPQGPTRPGPLLGTSAQSSMGAGSGGRRRFPEGPSLFWKAKPTHHPGAIHRAHSATGRSPRWPHPVRPAFGGASTPLQEERGKTRLGRAQQAPPLSSRRGGRGVRPVETLPAPHRRQEKVRGGQGASRAIELPCRTSPRVNRIRGSHLGPGPAIWRATPRAIQGRAAAPVRRATILVMASWWEPSQ
jgi:hypothetical protein